jgi:hypothetical protein
MIPGITIPLVISNIKKTVVTDTESATRSTDEINPDGTYKLDKPRKFYPPPLFIPSVTEYQDVGKNMELREQVTNFFYNDIQKSLIEDKSFKNKQKYLKIIKSKQGYKYIYYLLRLFVKKSNANWYDLRDSYNYGIVKDFLRFKIGSV